MNDKRALHGLIDEHQKLMLKTQLRHIDELDALTEKLDEEINRNMRPFEENLERTDTISEVERRTAEQILAEIGTDMNRSSSAVHLCSWAGLAPGNHECAGNKNPGRRPKAPKSCEVPMLKRHTPPAEGKTRIYPACIAALRQEEEPTAPLLPWPIGS